MKLYALGVVQDYSLAFDFTEIEMTIYQPRIDNISDFSMSRAALLQWGETVVRPKAKLAWAGKGMREAGSHCKFCRAKATCKALANFNMEIAKHEFADPETLHESEIANILERYDSFIDWIKAVEDYALKEAIKGKKWPGWKVVYGRSHRKYKSEPQVIKKLLKAGLKIEEITKQVLFGIGDMESLLGPADFNRLLSGLLIKPPGAPTLARTDAKGIEYDKNLEAKKDFA